MLRFGLLAIALFVGTLCCANSANAQNPAICPGLRGAERTACLERERDRAQRDADAANRNLARLERDMDRACTLAETGDALANGARIISPESPVRWAGRVWTSSRALGRAVTRQGRVCQEFRQELRQRQRNR
jgi:hypothetical protein